MKGVEQIGAFVASRGAFSFDNQQIDIQVGSI